MTLLITRGDGYVTTAQAGEMVHGSPATIRSWVLRGHLAKRGLDEHGHALYAPDDVAAAEKRVRDNGLRTSGIDPRRLRRAISRAA